MNDHLLGLLVKAANAIYQEIGYDLHLIESEEPLTDEDIVEICFDADRLKGRDPVLHEAFMNCMEQEGYEETIAFVAKKFNK